MLVDGSTPLVRDIDLAERAGLAATRNVRLVIQKNRAELEEHGLLSMRPRRVRIEKRGATCGFEDRDVLEYWLNEDQAVALVALLRTPMARALRVSLVKLFGAMRRGELVAAPVAFPIAEVHGSRVGETHARTELMSWCALAALAHGVTLHRIHGALRRQYKVPSAYALSVSVWPTARAFLEALATKRLFLDAPTRARPVLQLVQGGRQLGLFDGGRA